MPAPAPAEGAVGGPDATRDAYTVQLELQVAVLTAQLRSSRAAHELALLANELMKAKATPQARGRAASGRRRLRAGGLGRGVKGEGRDSFAPRDTVQSLPLVLSRSRSHACPPQPAEKAPQARPGVQPV